MRACVRPAAASRCNPHRMATQVHLTVFVPLPCNGGAPSVSAIEVRDMGAGAAAAAAMHRPTRRTVQAGKTLEEAL